MNWNDPTPTPVLADIIYAGAGGRQRARQELVGCIEMGCIEICSSKVAPDRTPTSTAWDVLKWDVLKSVGRKYEKGKLVKYKSACLCTIEHPINELVQYVLSLTDGKNSWDVGRKYEKGKLVACYDQ